MTEARSGHVMLATVDRRPFVTALLAAAGASLTSAQGPALLADVDCNGKPDAMDAALVLQLSAGLAGALDFQQRADTNTDGSVNSIGSALILKFAAELLDEVSP